MFFVRTQPENKYILGVNYLGNFLATVLHETQQSNACTELVNGFFVMTNVYSARWEYRPANWMTLDNKCSTHRSFLADYLFQLLTNLENFFLEIHSAQNTERLRKNKEARTQLHMALKRFAPHHGRLALSRVHDILAADKQGWERYCAPTTQWPTTQWPATEWPNNHTMTQLPHSAPITTEWQSIQRTTTRHTQHSQPTIFFYSKKVLEVNTSVSLR